MNEIPPGLTRKQRKRLAAAKRLAENEAKKKQLKQESEQHQAHADGAPVSPPPVSASNQQPVTAKADLGTKQNCHNESDGSPKATRAEETIARCTRALLILAAIQAVVMVWQNWIMGGQMAQTERQIELTQQQMDAAKADRRPWIVPGSFVLNRPIEIDRPLDFTVQFKNASHSPAIISGTGYKVAPRKAGADLGPDLANLWHYIKTTGARDNTLGPDGYLTVLADSNINVAVHEPEFKRIMSGEDQLFWMYACEYAGVDGGTYGIECCYVYDPVKAVFINYKKHNRLDVPPHERGK
jgi:hypothetical protein